MSANEFVVSAEEAVEMWHEEMEATRHDEDEYDGYSTDQSQQAKQELRMKWDKVNVNHTNPRFDGPDDMIPMSQVENINHLNNTYGSQVMEETFTITKSRMSSEVTFSHGISIPKTSILPRPDALTQCAEKFVLQEKGLEVSAKDDMSWTSEIKVCAGPGENRKFTTKLRDLTWQGDFTAITQLSGPFTVSVYENGRFDHSTKGDIVEIFHYAKQNDPDKFRYVQVNKKRQIVSVKTIGHMKFNFNVSKKTKVEVVDDESSDED